MTETETTDTDDLHHRLNALTLRLRNLENFPLSSDQTLWLVLSQTILAAYGLFGLLTAGLFWALDGPAEAVAIGQLFIHLAIATLMLLAIVIWVMNGIERLFTGS